MFSLFLNQAFIGSLSRALAWTFLHSLWEGLIAAILAAIIIALTRKSTASLRYNLLATLLILFVLSTGITFYYVWSPGSLTAIDEGIINPASSIVYESNTVLPVENSRPALQQQFSEWFNSNANIFMFAWVLIFMVQAVRILTGYAGVHRLKNYRTHATASAWTEKIKSLAQQMGIQRNIRFLESEILNVPVALGFLKPVILVPIGLIARLSPQQVETILLHELAHIRRNDYIVNLLQRICEAVFFFNPSLVWISSMLRQEREACCDDIVLAHSGNRRDYLDALVSFHEQYLQAPAWAMGITGKRQYLLERVNRMLLHENRKLGKKEQFLLIIGVLLFSAFTVVSKEKINPGNPVEQNKQEIASINQVPGNKQDNLQNKAVYIDTPPKKQKPVVSRKKTETPTYKVTHYSRNLEAKSPVLHETIKITNNQGKQYTIQKENGLYTKLVINENTIDKKDLPKYEPLLRKLENLVDKDSYRLPTDAQWKKASGNSIETQKAIQHSNEKQIEKQRSVDMENNEEKERDSDAKAKQQEAKDRMNKKIQEIPRTGGNYRGFRPTRKEIARGFTPKHNPAIEKKKEEIFDFRLDSLKREFHSINETAWSINSKLSSKVNFKLDQHAEKEVEFDYDLKKALKGNIVAPVKPSVIVPQQIQPPVKTAPEKKRNQKPIVI